MTLDLKVEREQENLLLIMEAKNLPLRWSKDEDKGETGKGEGDVPEEEPWKTALAEALFEKYGLLPESYEDLGAGSIRSMWKWAARSSPLSRWTPPQGITTGNGSQMNVMMIKEDAMPRTDDRVVLIHDLPRLFVTR